MGAKAVMCFLFWKAPRGLAGHLPFFGFPGRVVRPEASTHSGHCLQQLSSL